MDKESSPSLKDIIELWAKEYKYELEFIPHPSSPKWWYVKVRRDYLCDIGPRDIVFYPGRGRRNRLKLPEAYVLAAARPDFFEILEREVKAMP